MADPTSFFFANAEPGSPLSYAALQTRRKIAEQLMGKRSPFPKTFGEGLTYLGEGIGDAMQMNRLDAAERAREAGLTKIERDAPPSGVAAGGVENTAVAPAARPVSDAGTDTTAPVQTAAAPGEPIDITPSKFANVRYNNPGAQYPVSGANAAAFGQQGAGVIGGGHKIAQFPTPVQGAAANMDLLDRNYTGTTIGDAINKWSGGGRRNVPGFNTDTVITKEMMRDPSFAIPFMQAVAGGEAPGRYPMSADQWAQAHNMFAGVRGGTPVPMPPVDPRNRITQALMPQGETAAEPTPPPVQMAALTTPSVTSDAGPAASAVQAVAALPAQQPAQTPPLIPGSGPPIPSTIPLAPSEVRTPGVQTAQAGGPAIPALPANMPPDYEMAKPVPPPVPQERPKNERELYGERVLAQGIRRGDPQMQAMGQDYINREKAVRDHLYARDVEAYKNQYTHFSALDKLWQETQIAKQGKALTTNKAAQELVALPGELGRKATKEEIENQEKALKLRQETPVEPPSAPPSGTLDPRLGTPNSPQRTGIPAVPPVPAGVTPHEWGQKQAPEMVKAVSAYEKAVPQFNEAIATLRLARDHPGRESGTGFFSEAAKRIPGTPAYGFGKIMEQMAGKNFLTAYQQLKGGGAITEVEGTKAEAAQARLATAQNSEDFDKALNDLELALRGDLEQAQRKVNAPVTAWQRTNDDPYAPDKGERRGNQEYIGGNPAMQSSWRTIR